jgi:uracil phosphoribosyltransferase
MTTSALHVADHVLLSHHMAELRAATTPSPRFRLLLAQIGTLLAVEATRDLPGATARITTPLTGMDHRVMAGPEPVLVAVLRAGLGLLDGARVVLPDAPVGHIGLARDEHTLQPREYLLRLPSDAAQRGVMLFDPMLATGGSAVAAVRRLKEAGVTRIRFICVVAAPEGVAKLHAEHPDVPVLAAALDSHLNERGFIVPGLGDAGDRCFGTE